MFELFFSSLDDFLCFLLSYLSDLFGFFLGIFDLILGSLFFLGEQALEDDFADQKSED
jgi:hypothetical protein